MLQWMAFSWSRQNSKRPFLAHGGPEKQMTPTNPSVQKNILKAHSNENGVFDMFLKEDI